jgi:DnaK suppressor protein
MQKELIKTLKEKLEGEKAGIEKELGKFAKKDQNLKGDWDTKFPNWGTESGGSSSLEKSADEVEEYVTLLPIEHSLELKLEGINSALEKIEKGSYGSCEKCKKDIEEERLKVTPEAKFCIKCEGK